MKLDFRMHGSEDIDRLVEFWCHHSGWDIIDRNAWEKRFYNTPYGDSAIVIAENCEDKSIAAQFIFIPSKIHNEEKTYTGYRPFAPVIHKGIREKIGFLQMAGYILRMYHVAVRHFSASGVTLLHAMPDPRWARLFHLLKGSKIGYFPLYSLSLLESMPFTMGSGHTYKAISPDHEHINLLWEKASGFLGCCIVRNADALCWKLSHKNYSLIGAFDGEKLLGICAGIYKPEDKQWLICDILAENNTDAFLETVKAACLYAKSYRQSLPESEQHDCSKIAVLATRKMEESLRNLGFTMDTYKFPLFVQVLDRTINQKIFSPEYWYVSAND